MRYCSYCSFFFRFRVEHHYIASGGHKLALFVRAGGQCESDWSTCALWSMISALKMAELHMFVAAVREIVQVGAA